MNGSWLLELFWNDFLFSLSLSLSFFLCFSFSFGVWGEEDHICFAAEVYGVGVLEKRYLPGTGTSRIETELGFVPQSPSCNFEWRSAMNPGSLEETHEGGTHPGSLEETHEGGIDPGRSGHISHWGTDMQHGLTATYDKRTMELAAGRGSAKLAGPNFMSKTKVRSEEAGMQLEFQLERRTYGAESLNVGTLRLSSSTGSFNRTQYVLSRRVF